MKPHQIVLSASILLSLCITSACAPPPIQGASSLLTQNVVASSSTSGRVLIYVTPPADGYLVLLGSPKVVQPFFTVEAGGECKAKSRFLLTDAPRGDRTTDGVRIFLKRVKRSTPESITFSLPALLEDDDFERVVWPTISLLSEVNTLSFEIGFIPEKYIDVSNDIFSETDPSIYRLNSKNLNRFSEVQHIIVIRTEVLGGTTTSKLSLRQAVNNESARRIVP